MQPLTRTTIERAEEGIETLRHRKLWEGVQIALLVAMFGSAALLWSSVPEQIPVHWNAAGEVDRYGGRFEGLLLVPLIALGIYLLLLVIPRIDPARRNYEAFAGTWMLLRVSILVYLAFVGLVTQLAIGREETLPAAQLIVGSVGVLFMVLGGVMGRIEPNWFAGIRTPWTLSSTRSWEATHRLGGRLFVALGVLTLIAAVIGGTVALVTILGGMLVVLVVVSVYSYRVWRDDPDKVRLARADRR
ncbi:SdpI family protein [Actinotalea sp. M2MS4P-6]|uniref:SdpI family protein n=1 Tax=Actinotalea sp. M2MS4P-6 TaxID=2983762 RepID=UPI0021E44C96|nr:SdpI family protein [Actinotalea sp. M2MS4P-6]MCV2392682.1 SdpI family protein [Actinotalea sp. M2MS4P-6]